MVLPRWWAQANRVGLNRIVRHVAWWAPGMGVIVHRGRRSGREYRTPVLLFSRPGGYVVVLPYGTTADWVRNVQAADHAVLRTRRKSIDCAPRPAHHRAHPDLPGPARRLFAMFGVHDQLELTTLV